MNLIHIKTEKKFFRLFFILVLSSFSVMAYCQHQQVRLSGNNLTLKSAFKQVEQQTKMFVDYNIQEVNDSKIIKDIPHENNVRTVMEELLQGTGCNVTFNNNHIIIAKEKVQPSKAKVVKGSVKDAKGETIIGAAVKVKGTSQGTITDLDGNFSLQVEKGSILEISYVGYKNQEIEMDGRSIFDIVLMEDNQILDEIVVVGYGTVKRSDLTGSVSSLNATELTAASQPNAIDALQGKISGVNITRNAARPGGSYNITVRGLSSINNSNTPLWVIDGIPSSSDASDLNPADIEKIDVLKDASATAIYGSRGANGVVIVTTKRGKEGHFNINYDGYYGVRTASNLPKMMNGDEYVNFRTELFENQGKSTDRSNAEFFTSDEWNRIDNKDYTDWINLVLRSGQQYSNTITASGGDDKGTFSVGISQLHEEGTVRDQDFNRYNMHLNVNRKFLKEWKLGGSMYFTYSKQNEGSYETLRSAYRLPQVASPYDEDGNLVYHVFRNDAVTNPLLESSKDGEHRENKRYRVFGNIFLQFTPIKGLTLKSQFAPQMLYTRDGTYIGVNAKNSSGKTASVTASYDQSMYWGYVWDNQITYEKKIGKHNFNASLVQSLQMEQWEYSNQSAKNFSFNSEWYNLDAASLSDVTESSTDFQKRTLSSVLGRLQYSYNDRYLFTASGRFDGSSRLSEGNKWAFFLQLLLRGEYPKKIS